MDLCGESLLNKQLFEEAKGVTWAIEASGYHNGELIYDFGSGFSVGKIGLGLIMTASHVLPDPDATFTVKARKLDEAVYREARVKYRRPDWDVAVLELNVPINCKEGLLASDGSLYIGQPLAHLGNPLGHYGTFVVGRARYRCVDDVDMPTGNQTCETYDSSLVSEPQRYRILGHYFDSKVLYKPGSSSKDRDPMVPVVVVSGLCCGPGSSGGPLFKSDGTIVGMLILDTPICVHVSLLRECLRIATSIN